MEDPDFETEKPISEDPSDKNYNIDVIIVAALFVVISIYLSTIVFKAYSWSLFVATPFLHGLVCSILLAYNKNNNLGSCIKKSFLSLLLATAMVMVFAIEGLICILMASPILGGLNIIGSLIGYYLAQYVKIRRKMPLFFSVFLINPAFIALESQHEATPQKITAETTLLVNASESEVWESLVSENNYSGFDNLFFSSGVAYPESTRIKTSNGKQYFICDYSQGQVALPVKSFVVNKKLAFGFDETPAPMKELSFYDDLHLPHLHGYFNISSGQIELKKISACQTRLTARTVYTYNIKPLFYWKGWTNYLLNQVHHQVLTTIKTKSEKNYLEHAAPLSYSPKSGS